MSNTVFMDTCSILNAQEAAFDSDSKFYISNITINELENIKTSGTKDEETKYAARTLLHLLEKNPDKYEIVLYKNSYLERLLDFDLPNTPDSKIIATAYCFFLDNNIQDGIFLTADLACKAIAHSIGLTVDFPKEEDDVDDYTGYYEAICDDNELALFYGDYLVNNVNHYNLLDNQYILLKNSSGEVIDKYKWHENKYNAIPFLKADSRMFGKVVPLNGDPYQQLAFDSLSNNQITMLRGAAGSGKSLISLAYLFSLLEHGKINKIIVFCNTVAAKGAAKLGFYPGDKNDKLLDSQIGNFLSSKLGDRVAVERMIDDGELVLLPLADIRGYDTSGMNAGIYMTEAQNLDIELMKLALQRIGDDCICIIDGDDQTQVDLSMYAGRNNGMRRVSQVFRGSDIYGEVTLANIHRSKIAELAQKM